MRIRATVGANANLSFLTAAFSLSKLNFGTKRDAVWAEVIHLRTFPFSIFIFCKAVMDEMEANCGM